MTDENETIVDDGNDDIKDMETQVTSPAGEVKTRTHKRTTSEAPNIPDLTISKELGRGGMGVVYEGRQGYLDRRVAVKVLLSQFTKGDSQFAERFQREAKILAQLNHPHIVSCYQAGVLDDGNCYLVMEFIEGSNLEEWIAEHGALSPEQALGVVRTIAEALDYANKNGIIHRDVKPENILLGSEPMGDLPFTPKLVDLGLARPDSNSNMQLTAQGTIMGTPATMAPEQFDDPDNVDQRADIYGLGCVFYQALCAQAAFTGKGLSQLMEAKLHAEAPNPQVVNAGVPSSLVALVAAMLAKDRDQRVQDYDDLLARLDAVDGTTAVKKKTASSLLVPVLIALIIIPVLITLFFPFDEADDASFQNQAADLAPVEVPEVENKTQQISDNVEELDLIPNTSQLLNVWSIEDGQWGREEEGTGIAGYAPKGTTARMSLVLEQAVARLDLIYGGHLDEGKKAAFNNCAITIYFADDSMWDIKIVDYAAAISIVTTPPKSSDANAGTASLDAEAARLWKMQLSHDEDGWKLAFADFQQELRGFHAAVTKIQFAVKEGNVFIRDAVLNRAEQEE